MNLCSDLSSEASQFTHTQYSDLQIESISEHYFSCEKCNLRIALILIQIVGQHVFSQSTHQFQEVLLCLSYHHRRPRLSSRSYSHLRKDLEVRSSRSRHSPPCLPRLLI